MRVLSVNIEELKPERVSSITVGSFDGLHKGHIKIIKEMEKHRPNLLITFSPHPKVFLENRKNYVLTSEEEKIDILQKFKIDFLLFLKFNESLKNLNYLDFLKILKDKFYPSFWISGPDHTFGNNARGNTLSLWKFCIENNIILILIPYEKMGRKKISSSLLREVLKKGRVEEYTRLTGRHYEVRGKIERGKGLGKKIGFPTLNITVEPYKILPKKGVYRGEVEIKGEVYLSAINVGGSPTLSGGARIVEAHILHFDRNVYGEEVKVIFKEFLRDIKKFESIESLKKQIQEDIESIIRR